MNSQVDLVVIGDSIEGSAIIRKVANGRPSIKIAFISKNFRSATTRDFLNVEYIKETVVYTDYKNRLFGIYLANGDRIYCTHLVIATGLAYAPFTVGNRILPDTFNNVSDIPKIAKNLPALVVGNTGAAAKLALQVAKKYKQVYLCANSFTLTDITPAVNKKINSTDNVLVLPNTSIIKFHVKKDKLVSVELDNYSTVTCSAVFVKTAATPETDFVSNIIEKSKTKYLVTDARGQSTLVPKCFAIGNCVLKNSSKLQKEIIDSILSDFKEDSK